VRFLVVDDERDILSLISLMLTTAGYPDVVEATSAEEAYAYLRLGEPERAPADVDLVLMDMTLPGDDGTAAVARIRADARYRDIPMIMVTAHNEDATLQRAFDAGVTDYIRKPFGRVEFLARVRAAAALKQELDQRKARERDLIRTAEQLQATQQVLERLSLSDGLTGLANRRCFDDTLSREWERAQRDFTSVGLVMCDLDYFKAYNDSYGHPAGDQVLRSVAQALEGAIHRTADIAARYGGEEFVILLPETDAEGARVVAELARGAVQAMALPHREGIARVVTVSMGVAAIRPSHGARAAQLVADADEALYRAKQQGRNRVVMHEGGGPEPGPLDVHGGAGSGRPVA